MPKNSIEDVRARFDQVAAEWDSNPGRAASTKKIVDAIRKAVVLRPDMNALDFGAGTGLITLGLLPYVGRLTAVDASLAMVQVLDEKLKALRIANVQTMARDIGATPLPASEFDLIVSSMVLHHLPDVPQTLRHLRSSLRPGGWIALADLDSEDGSFHSNSSAVFHHGLDRNAIRQWLLETGFTDTVIREAHRMARTAADGKSREYPVFLATARAG